MLIARSTNTDRCPLMPAWHDSNKMPQYNTMQGMIQTEPHNTMLGMIQIECHFTMHGMIQTKCHCPLYNARYDSIKQNDTIQCKAWNDSSNALQDKALFHNVHCSKVH